MTTYRERLTAPVSWWLAAVLFAAVWGWVMLVATTWAIAGVLTALLVAADVYAVWRYGSVVVEVDHDELRAGAARIPLSQLGEVTALNREQYRLAFGPQADPRAYFVTRPYLDHGVRVTIDDPSDPTPHWLISSRHPTALAEALGAAAPTTSTSDTNGGTPRG